MENDPHEMNNLVDDPAYQDELVWHHQRLRQMIVDTDDHYILAPALGEEGLNLWKTS